MCWQIVIVVLGLCVFVAFILKSRADDRKMEEELRPYWDRLTGKK
jgi:hypothetical protein